MTAPLVYTLIELKIKQDPLFTEFEKMLKRKCDQPGDVNIAIETLFASSGIEMSDKLSI